MRVLINLLRGFRSTRGAARAVLVLYLANLALSLVLVVPLYNSLASSLGASQAGDRMARGFDYQWWEEFRDAGHGLSRTFGPSIIGGGALLNNLEALLRMRWVGLPSEVILALLFYILLHTFLVGGLLAVYRDEPVAFDFRRFADGAVRYFPRFLGLTALSWLFFFAVGFLLLPRLESIVGRLSSTALTEKPGFYAGLAAALVVWFLLMFIQMVFDYARILTVAEERRNIFRAGLDGLAFVLRHPLAALGLYYSLFLAGLLLALADVLLKGFVVQSTAGGVLLAFAVQQAFILGLVGLRCWTYASQFHLLRYFPR
jgi:hypothetical protein